MKYDAENKWRNHFTCYIFNRFIWIFPHSCIPPVCCPGDHTGRPPGTGCSPLVALATSGSSWRQEIGGDGDRGNDGSAADRDAAESERFLRRKRRRKRRRRRRHGEFICLSSLGQRSIKFDLIHLAVCRCGATAAAPSLPPSAWSTGSHDPRSPGGRTLCGRWGPSASRRWSAHRTVRGGGGHDDRQRRCAFMFALNVEVP